MEPVVSLLEKEYGDRVDFKSYNTMEERGRAERYGISFVPTFVFIDAEGITVSKVVGEQSLDLMRSEMEKILE
jgi:predicted DsbA family dithiol-disulfide isomerase